MQGRAQSAVTGLLAIQAMGVSGPFGFLSVVLAVLKLTVAGYWSWWRVMLPFLAFLGHNVVYLLAGFLCFCWLKHKEDEEDITAAEAFEGGLQHSGAVVIFLPVVWDSPVATRRRTRLERVWPCWGSFEWVVLFGMLSLVAQFVYWSRIVSGLNQEHA